MIDFLVDKYREAILADPDTDWIVEIEMMEGCSWHTASETVTRVRAGL